MRRVRRLQFTPYIVALKQQFDRVVLADDNILLQRVYHSSETPKVDIHAKFNPSTMNGIMVLAALRRGSQPLSSVLVEASLYRISDSSWTETLIGSITLTPSLTGVHSGTVTQSSLGSNELSGRETYSIDVELQRHFRRYRKKLWFNHLGIYDSLNMARQMIENIDVIKVIE